MKSTYYYQVLREYSSDEFSRDDKMKARILADLQELEDAGCLQWADDCVGVSATKMGTVMMRHSILLSTMSVFRKIPAEAGMRQCLEAVCGAGEFGDMVVRRKQKKWLNEVNWTLGRFKNKNGKERIQTSAQKIFQLCQALFGRINPPDPTLRMEMQQVSKVGSKVCTAMVHFFLGVRLADSPTNSFPVSNSFLAPIAARLLRCFTARCWEDDQLSQLKGVGPVLSKKLRDAGFHSINQLRDQDNIERIISAVGSQSKGRAIAASASAIGRLGDVSIKTKLAADGRLQIFVSACSATDPRDFSLFVVALTTGGNASRKLLLHKLNLHLNTPKVFTLNKSSIMCEYIEIYLPWQVRRRGPNRVRKLRRRLFHHDSGTNETIETTSQHKLICISSAYKATSFAGRKGKEGDQGKKTQAKDDARPSGKQGPTDDNGRLSATKDNTAKLEKIPNAASVLTKMNI